MNIIKDKLRIVASLTPEEIEHIKKRFPCKRPNPYFKYCYFQRKPHFFAVWLLPMKGYVYRYFNAMLSFNPANPPLEALEIFNMIEPERWKVSRLDIAFDFLTPYEDSFLLPPPTNIKINRFNTTLYYGAVRSACTVCQYNKQKQLKEVHGIESVPLTRIEFRFKPKLKPITQYEKKDFVKMEGYRFVSNTKELTGLRCLLKSITNGKRDWKTLGRKDKQEISAAVKERTVDMLDLFLEYIEGDIEGFMLDGLSINPTKNEQLHAV
ncbi:hypothetical protein D3P09_16125 [Paenibacillus pinisoli]|uniref:Uncharacterized protein n=1 Tax=Paenibacillus pinisoli TaxID=1276110 RepID=A0A3A6PL05_9BACL|nr:hypothetical protein [Paenibacillus pinisoli]RJX39029.1 hypothetical protein D3P09_16125 [Paenibacillus pinisoli]